MKNLLHYLLLLATLFGCQPASPPATDLAAGFATPPLEARPRGLWTWINGNYDTLEMRREMREAREKGMGGFDIWDAPPVRDPDSIVPIGPGVTSAHFMQGIAAAARIAQQEGLELGVIWNQSVSYLDPALSHKALYHSELTVSGGNGKSQPLVLPFPHLPPNRKFGYALLERDERGRPLHYGEVAVFAFPAEASVIEAEALLDLGDRLRGDTLDWNAPPGRWKVLRFIWARTPDNGLVPTPNSRKPPVDFLLPEATETHLSWYLRELETYTGPLGDTPIRYFAADSYEFKGLWTPSLPDTFAARLGYSLRPYLPVLAGYVVENEEASQRFTFDFRRLLSDLVIRHHYAKATEVCNRFGIGFVAEAAGPGPPTHLNVPMESLESSGVLTYPRGEFWVEGEGKNRDNNQIIKGIASAANLYDQPYVEAEAFTGVYLWQHGPGDLKPYADRFFAQGLNRIAFHTFPHSPPAAGKPGWIYGFGNIISENLIWWPQAKGFMDYLGRCSYLLQQGHFVADALYYHGSGAPFFARPKHVKPELGLGYDYELCNADILLNRLTVKNGRLTLPHGQSYPLLVLPEKDWMPLAVLEKIEQLLADGAVVIGPKPVRSRSLQAAEAEDAQVRALADQVWDKLDGRQHTQRTYGQGQLFWGPSPREVLQAMGIAPDLELQTAAPADTLEYLHRQAETADIYFIRNPYPKAKAVQLNLREASRRPERWNPVNGEVTPLTIYAQAGGRTEVPLNLPPHGSLFLVFREAAGPGTSVSLNGKLVFPGEKVPLQWPFEEIATGEGRSLVAGELALERNARKTVKVLSPDTLPLQPASWSLSCRDPWDQVFQTELPDLISWSEAAEERLRFFSGEGTYETTLELTGEQLSGRSWWLDLGAIEEVAEVWVNEQLVGQLWTPPLQLKLGEALSAGRNQIRIKVRNRWPNRLIGDYRLPRAARQVRSNITSLPNGWFAPLETLPSEHYALQASGLLGPVRLIGYDAVPLGEK